MNQLPEPPSAIRVGHVYLDVQRRTLRCLNETAQHLHGEGVPFLPSDLEAHSLQTLDGREVKGDDLPLLAAWRQLRSIESRFILPRDSGAVWHVSWSASPVAGSDRRLRGVLGTVTCTAPNPDLRRLSELAHDLRTPLQSLRLLCSMLKKEKQEGAELIKALETIQASGDRAIQIALELLDCCRGPVAKNGSTSWVALEPLLVNLANEQTVVAQSKGLSLTTDFNAVRGWETRLQPVRFGRVLSNLLVNAVRYTPRGCVAFTAAWREDGSKRQLALSVADTGPGITEEEQDSIFHPFERGRAGMESDSGGSGLGLAVVDRLVDELGLTLEVYSQYGHGSTFHLLIPASVLRLSAGK